MAFNPSDVVFDDETPKQSSSFDPKDVVFDDNLSKNQDRISRIDTEKKRLKELNSSASDASIEGLAISRVDNNDDVKQAPLSRPEKLQQRTEEWKALGKKGATAEAYAIADQQLEEKLEAGNLKGYDPAGERITSRAEEAQAAQEKQARLAQQDRSGIDVVRDTSAQLLEGGVNIAKAPIDLLAPESDLAATLNKASEALYNEQSPQLQAKLAQAQQRIQEAGKNGLWEEVKAAVAEYATDPAMAARFTVTNIASLIPGLGAAKAAELAALAKGASAAHAMAVAGGAAMGTNAVLNAGGARGEAFRELKGAYIAQGYTETEAELKAISESRLAAAVGGVAGAVSGKLGVENALFGGAAQGGFKAGAKSFAGEMFGEQVEELSPQLATNVQLNQIDGRSVTQGLGSTMVQTALGAGPVSAAAGVISGVKFAGRPIEAYSDADLERVSRLTTDPQKKAIVEQEIARRNGFESDFDAPTGETSDQQLLEMAGDGSTALDEAGNPTAGNEPGGGRGDAQPDAGVTGGDGPAAGAPLDGSGENTSLGDANTTNEALNETGQEETAVSQNQAVDLEPNQGGQESAVSGVPDVSTRVSDEKAVATLEQATGKAFNSHAAESIPARQGDTAEVVQARREEAGLMDKLFDAAGLKVHWITNKDGGTAGFGGVKLEGIDGHVFVDANNPGFALRVLAGHESLHDLRSRAPEAYKSLVKALQDDTAFLTKGMFQRQYDSRKKGERVELRNEDHAIEEQVANLWGNVLHNPANVKAMLDRLYPKDVKGAAKFIAIIQQALSRVWQNVNQLGGRFNAKKYEGDFKSIEKRLMDAYVEFAKAQGKSPVVAELAMAQAKQSPEGQKAEPVKAEQKAPKEGNHLGFQPQIRTVVPNAKMIIGKNGKPETLIGQATTNKNADKLLANLDRVFSEHKDPTKSVDAWNRMSAMAFGTNDVPIPPYALIERLKDPVKSFGALLGKLSEGQIRDADHGFANAKQFRRLYLSGEADVETTGKLFLWSFLSRGVSPYVQEGLFVDAVEGAGKFIKLAAQGKFDAKAQAEYLAWAKGVAPENTPGRAASHNLNAFGKSFLTKMSVPDENGKTSLQKLHEMMADPTMTGRQIRREFQKFGEGVGIDNKVVSFTLLVSGHEDVIVLDRVQIGGLWNDGRFDGYNLYDGIYRDAADGSRERVPGSGIADLGAGVRGLLQYEAIEDAVAKVLPAIYKSLGREKDASLGRFHWDTWVAYSNQEASHATLDAILNDAEGIENPYDNVTAKEGEYSNYNYGMQYGRDRRGPYFIYQDSKGQNFEFSPEEKYAFYEAIRNPKNGVVPKKGWGTRTNADGSERTGPWFNDPRVNREKLDEFIRQFGHPATGARSVREHGEGASATGSRFSAESVRGAVLARLRRSLQGRDKGAVPRPYSEPVGRAGKLLVAGKEVTGKVWRPTTAAGNTLRSVGHATPNFVEISGANAAEVFRSAISASKEKSEFGAAVYVYELGKYAKMRLFVTEDGLAGFAVKSDGDIVSVFNSGKTHSRAAHTMLHLAVQAGGRKLDAFDTQLPFIYAESGFSATARLKWLESESPAGWDKKAFKSFNNGEPDVVFMAYDINRSAPYSKGEGAYAKSYAEAVASQIPITELSNENQADSAEQGGAKPVQRGGSGTLQSPEGQAAESYGESREGSITVTGVHYSQAQRPRLDSRYYGSGLKGEESQRLKDLPPEYRYRTFFYVNEGNGVRPEAGVGGHAHAVNLNNVYDSLNDPLNLAVNSNGDNNAFEKLVVDRGFDGYYVPPQGGQQGFAVLVGQHSVPVEYKGTQFDGKEYAPPARAKKSDYVSQIEAIKKDNTLPGGELKGSRWKEIMATRYPDLDLSHLEDDKGYYKSGLVKKPEMTMSPEGAAPQRVLSAWKQLASQEDLYQYKISKEKDLEAIAKDIAGGELEITGKGTPEAQRKKGVVRSWEFSMPGDRGLAYVFEHKNGDIWIDASSLESGFSQGSLLYAVIGNYAFNNGKVFIGDPAGLSDHAVIRRTEHMLASALKFGTTKHLAPGKRQTSPNYMYELYDSFMHTEENSGNTPLRKWITPLEWSDDDGKNFESLVKASYINGIKLAPEMRHVTYDFDTDSFKDRSGKTVQLGTIVKQAKESASARGFGHLVGSAGAGDGQQRELSYPLGSATAKRLALANTVLRSEKLDLTGRVVSGTRLEGAQYSPEAQQAAPVFFSQLARSVEQAPAKLDNGPAQQWKAWILSNQSKLGIKSDEIQWTGISEWLDLQGKAKVSKQQIADYLNQNGVQVQEVEKDEGIKDFFVQERTGDIVKDGFKTYEEADDWADENGYEPSDVWIKQNDENSGSTKYGDYQLPGGENYRELLLTLPEKKGERPDEVAVRLFGRRMNDLSPADREKVRSEIKSNDRSFKSSHWEEPNILAHIRFNGRTDADGAKTLFIEEIQGDWQQEYRKQMDLIANAVDDDFLGIIKRMEAAGVLEVNCD